MTGARPELPAPYDQLHADSLVRLQLLRSGVVVVVDVRHALLVLDGCDSSERVRVSPAGLDDVDEVGRRRLRRRGLA